MPPPTMDDEDAGVVELAWKAALDAHAGAGEEEDAFATLDAALGSYAAAAAAAAAHEPAPPVTSPPAVAAPAQRLKRRNFSKELQLLSLQRYAAAAREAGRLPSREETHELLRQSYALFLRRGGAPDEPRLTPPEFLKLIRNRRREIRTRARRPRVLAARAAVQSATAGKRKLQEENDRIRDLIEAIDRAGGRASLRVDCRRAEGRAEEPSLRPEVEEEVPSAGMQGSQDAQSTQDAQDALAGVLQALAETREVQREIGERVESIQRMLLHLDGPDEPSSASV